jgi:hypothetical protein
VGAGVLTSEERTQVQREFADALADSDGARRLIRDVFPEREEQLAILRHELTNDALTLARITLDECLLSRWTRTPPMLGTLLRYLVDIRGIGSFDPLLDRVVSQRTDPNQSFYEDTWLLDDTRPFFDRHDLRTKIRQLIDGNGRPILRLPKDGVSYGRSYTLDFLAHLEERRGGDVSVIAAEIADGGGPSYAIEDLLNQVSAALSSGEPLPERTRSSYAESAVLWLLRLMKPGPRWVLVLDGFGQQGVADEVHETVRLLARWVTVAQYRRRVRLVLLGYPPEIPGLETMLLLAEKLPNVKLADVLTETLPPAASICQRDLLPCLEAWNGLRRKQGLPGLADDELAKLADGLLARAPAGGKERLAALHLDLLMLLDLPGGGPDGAVLRVAVGRTDGRRGPFLPRSPHAPGPAPRPRAGVPGGGGGARVDRRPGASAARRPGAGRAGGGTART